MGNVTKHPDAALAAMRCILTDEHSAQYVVESGNPSARTAPYDDPQVREAYPMGEE